MSKFKKYLEAMDYEQDINEVEPWTRAVSSINAKLQASSNLLFKLYTGGDTEADDILREAGKHIEDAIASIRNYSTIIRKK